MNFVRRDGELEQEVETEAFGELHGCVYPLIDERDVDKAAHIAAIREVCSMLAPVPMQHRLIRVGGAGDGGYLIPDDLDGVSACFSPGVDNRKDFEDELAHRFNIKSHMCDFTSDETTLKTPLIPGMQTFLKRWLDAEGVPDAVTLDQWVEQLAGPAEELMLQIDIEGAEYRALLACKDATLARCRIVCIEIHSLFDLSDASKFYGVFYPFFKKLSAHFVTVHMHPNNYNSDKILPGTEINIPNSLELTLLRRDRVRLNADAPLIAPQLPHPLDVVNAPHLEPIVLNAFWLGGRERSLESRLQILSNQLDFVKARSARDLEKAYKAVQGLAELVGRLTENQIGEPLAPPRASFVGLVEVAVGKPFRLNASLEPLPEDPRVPAVGDKPYFFHTPYEPNAYIEVDLGELRRIRTIVIHNRRGSKIPDRAYPLFLTLGRELGADYEQVVSLRINDAFIYGAAPLIKTLKEPVEARYVRIGTPVPAYLHFQGLRIYAEP